MRLAASRPSSRSTSAVCWPSSGGARSKRSGASAKLDRAHHLGHAAGERMRQVAQHPAMLHLRVVEHLRDGVDRAAGHAGRVQGGDERVALPSRRSRSASSGDSSAVVAHARRVLGEARRRAPSRAGRSPRTAWRTGRHCRRPARNARRRGEHVLRLDVGMAVATALRRLAADQLVHRLVRQEGRLRRRAWRGRWSRPGRSRRVVPPRPGWRPSAYMPVIRSTIGTPTFCGPPPGASSRSPVTLIRPPMAWMAKS